jgi:two-component system LytT family sensor kinase
MIKKTFPYYWWCQVFGWGLVGGSMLFFARIFDRQIDGVYIGRILTVFATGITTTHLLRAFLLKTNWLNMPIEKILLKLIIAGIATGLVFIVFQMIAYQVFKLGPNIRAGFLLRMFANLLNIGGFTINWTLIYYFYHYYQKTSKEQIQNRRLKRLLKSKQSDFEKSNVDMNAIEISLENIKQLIDRNPVQARKAITDFSNLLRRGHLNPET